VCLLPRDLHSFIVTCTHIVTRGWRMIFGLQGFAGFVQVCLGIACSNWSEVITWFCTTCVLYLIHANWLTSAVQRSLSEFFYLKIQGSLNSSAKLFPADWGNSGSLPSVNSISSNASIVGNSCWICPRALKQFIYCALFTLSFISSIVRLLKVVDGFHICVICWWFEDRSCT